MPPKKKLMKAVGQCSISSFLSKSTSAVLPRSVSENGSGASKLSDPSASNADLTKSLPSAPAPDEGVQQTAPSQTSETVQKLSKRKVQDSWFRIWPWLFEEKGALFCRKCVDTKQKNVFATSGCQVFKTSSMSRHEKSDEHIFNQCLK
jgi:hypothetical protein